VPDSRHNIESDRLWVAEIPSRIEMIDWRWFAGKLCRHV
jgi:hypothetical protein